MSPMKHDLRQKWSALEQRWAGYLVALTPESLGELVYRKSTSSGLGKRFGPRRGDVLLHVCTHAGVMRSGRQGLRSAPSETGGLLILIGALCIVVGPIA